VRAIEALIESLGDENFTFSMMGDTECVREFAVKTLMSICDRNPSIKGHLCGKLVDFISKTGDVAAISDAAIMLGRIGGKREKAILLPLLNHPCPAIRGRAAEALGLLKATEAVKEIGRLLTDEETATISRTTARVGDSYADGTYHEHKESVGKCAAVALEKIGTPEAEQILKEWDRMHHTKQ
jgi:HEAT repeat protein